MFIPLTCCPCHCTPTWLILAHWRQSPSSIDKHYSGDSKEDRWWYGSPWETESERACLHELNTSNQAFIDLCHSVASQDRKAKWEEGYRDRKRENAVQDNCQQSEIPSGWSWPVDVGFGQDGLQTLIELKEGVDLRRHKNIWWVWFYSWLSNIWVMSNHSQNAFIDPWILPFLLH